MPGAADWDWAMRGLPLSLRKVSRAAADLFQIQQPSVRGHIAIDVKQVE